MYGSWCRCPNHPLCAFAKRAKVMWEAMAIHGPNPRSTGSRKGSLKPKRRIKTRILWRPNSTWPSPWAAVFLHAWPAPVLPHPQSKARLAKEGLRRAVMVEARLARCWRSARCGAATGGPAGPQVGCRTARRSYVRYTILQGVVNGHPSTSKGRSYNQHRLWGPGIHALIYTALGLE